ncbi:DUF1330 domain-containing protein [Streptomyces sp. RKAG293]|uniref:DUF1330 domain-containing protein n=1 Tax=Streptomyces sp. RKAG293 TaxID=2893403 RepID=UPI0020331D92|nr:DUF1330 domain-containing protein [Streptomyces sp. RKAG293]MCM2416576.1 DUF1330 domain-containing protein [Streptomyces sp. RKAG293]
MAVYVVAQISINDRAAYGRYLAGFMDVLRRFEGKLMAADENPIVEEGEWKYDKAILISFPDEVLFRRWAGSPDYQMISIDRKAGTNGVVILVKGI